MFRNRAILSISSRFRCCWVRPVWRGVSGLTGDVDIQEKRSYIIFEIGR